MTGDTRWLLMSFSLRNKVRELKSIAKAIPHNYRPYNPVPYKKSDLVAYIRSARETYWDERQAAGSKATPCPDLCEITAAECNEFLRGLPVEEPE